MAIGNDELLDYVLEKDMEDTVSRVILNTLHAWGPMGKKKLSNLLRGKNPYQFRTPLHYPKNGIDTDKADQDGVLYKEVIF